MSLAPGDRLDRYVILERLGSGGMGEVFRARDTRLDRMVALKVLHRFDEAEVGSGGSATAGAARMMREARAAAALAHPNVVSVFDVGEASDPPELRGTMFLAMELVHGKPLRAFVGDASIPLAERMRWLGDVARALAAAHQAGLVHRDIKPENVMVRTDGVVKVLDFGIAKRAYRPVDPTSSTEGAHLAYTITQQGVAVGTPYYMAPEQMRGQPIDGRADQFSWGVLAYELLCGAPPWSLAGDALQIVAEVLTHHPAPPRAKNPEVPLHVSEAIMKALSKSADRRYASMPELLEYFEGKKVLAATERAVKLVSSAPPPPPEEPAPETRRSGRPPPKPSHARRWAAAGALGVAATAAIGFAAWRGGWTKSSTAPPGSASAAPATECASNAECVRAHAGKPFVCQRPERTCVALESEDCTVSAEPGDVENDGTIFIGSMFPLTGDDAPWGKLEAQAVELGRRDFAEATRGLATARPIAVLSCDDAVDAARVARHLVAARAPAVVGGFTKTGIENLAASSFLPHDMLVLVSINAATRVTTVPQAPGSPRLIWRTTFATRFVVDVASRIVSQRLEPSIRRGPPAMTPSEPLRVAIVRTAASALNAQELFDVLRFNGKSALENGQDFREFPMPDVNRASDAELAAKIRDIGAFAPHVIVLYYDQENAASRFLEPLESSWHGRMAPTYLVLDPPMPATQALVARSRSLRRRFFALTNSTTTATNARLVMHYNEAFPSTPVTRMYSPNTSYDAFYLAAYAVLASKEPPVEGSVLARAIERLLPPGKRVDIGPSGIFEAIATLQAGENVDLNGSAGTLDFDATTGDAPVPLALVCVAPRADGAAELRESGLVFDPASRSLRGEIDCR